MALNLVLLGPPGAGKGTQAERFARARGFPKISTGDILREAVAAGTPLGCAARATMDAGGLVGDDVMIGIVRERLERPDTAAGFVLDGFPRTVAQAEVLDRLLAAAGWPRPLVVHFAVAHGVLLRRLAGRRVCTVGGEIYNIYEHPPKVAGRCDHDGGALVQRPDDSEEVIHERLVTYQQHTLPVLDYYRRAGLVEEVNGEGTPEQVTAAVVAIVEKVVCGDGRL